MTAGSNKTHTRIPWSYNELVRAEYIIGRETETAPVWAARVRATRRPAYVEVPWSYRQLLRAA